MPICRRSVLVSGFWIALTASAVAQSVPLPREAQVGPRPFYLVDKMKDGPLKTELSQCTGPFHKTDFSIGHRGAALQFPEHSKESYTAAARMGAGVIECDVTFTKDRQLVCRHSQCDLHTTTNILSVPALAAKCTQPFSPADPATGKKASAKCCTSDITLAEFKTLAAKMDGFNPDAVTAADYQNGTPRWRTDLYAASGTLMTHDESIALIKSLGAKFTPELKAPEVAMPFDGDYSREKYATQMLQAYKTAGIPPENVFPQSFDLADILFWVKTEPAFAAQAVYLEDRYEKTRPRSQQARDLETVYGRTQSGGRENPGAADLRDAGAQRQKRDYPLRIRQARQSRGPRSDRLVAGARRPAQQGRRLLSQVHQGRDRPRRRHPDGARCTGKTGRRPRHVFGLAGDHDVLCELHGDEVS
jgi:glycerophosphoryl diester phosphodiesterase